MKSGVPAMDIECFLRESGKTVIVPGLVWVTFCGRKTCAILKMKECEELGI